MIHIFKKRSNLALAVFLTLSSHYSTGLKADTHHDQSRLINNLCLATLDYFAVESNTRYCNCLSYKLTTELSGKELNESLVKLAIHLSSTTDFVSPKKKFKPEPKVQKIIDQCLTFHKEAN